MKSSFISEGVRTADAVHAIQFQIMGKFKSLAPHVSIPQETIFCLSPVDYRQYPGPQFSVQSVVNGLIQVLVGHSYLKSWWNVFSVIFQKMLFSLARSSLWPIVLLPRLWGVNTCFLCIISHSFISYLHFLPPAHITVFSVCERYFHLSLKQPASLRIC